jgi:hypothetical protein
LQDHAKLAFKVSDLETATKDNNRKMSQLGEDVEAQKKNIMELFKLSDEFRKEMDELGEQVAELYLLKKNINVSSTACMNCALYILPCYSIGKLSVLHICRVYTRLFAMMNG